VHDSQQSNHSRAHKNPKRKVPSMDSIDPLEFLPCADLHEEEDEDYLQLITDLSNNTDHRAYANTVSFDDTDTVQMDHQQETFSEPITAPGSFDVVHFQTDRPPEVGAISDFRMHSQQGTSNEPIIAPARFDVVASQTSRVHIATHARFNTVVLQTSSEPITALARFDVVTGRGQGIQQLSGNKMYRELVSMNKRIYDRCHEHDKRKVSKGIVKAIRDFGGRFLECDEKSQTYYDIGDKKAWVKTSQALRDCQTNLRDQFGPQTEFEADLLGSSNAQIPRARYFAYTNRMLQSLFDEDEQSRTYYDIGNERAWDKTSQALREGQTIIREQLRPQTNFVFSGIVLPERRTIDNEGQDQVARGGRPPGVINYKNQASSAVSSSASQGGGGGSKSTAPRRSPTSSVLESGGGGGGKAKNSTNRDRVSLSKSIKKKVKSPEGAMEGESGMMISMLSTLSMQMQQLQMQMVAMERRLHSFATTIGGGHNNNNNNNNKRKRGGSDDHNESSSDDE
jgi:hypothetical protein